MKNEEIELLLQEGRDLTEDEHFFSAFLLLENAFQIARRSGEKASQVQAYADRVNAIRHHYDYTGEDLYKDLCLHTAEVMLQIAQDGSVTDKLSLAYYRKATAYMLNGDYLSAVDCIRAALDPKIFRGSEAQRADWDNHLVEAEVLAGVFEGTLDEILNRVKVNTEAIRANRQTIDPYTAHVWMSGGYLILARLAKPKSRTQTLIYWSYARDVIDAHDTLYERKLKIRRHELKKLWEELNK